MQKNIVLAHESLSTNKQEKNWSYIAFPFFWIMYSNQCIREKHIWKYNLFFKIYVELLLNSKVKIIFHGSTPKIWI